MARFCHSVFGLLLAVVANMAMPARLSADDAAMVWNTDYRAAMDAARQEHKTLVVLFHAPGDDQAARDFEAMAAADLALGVRLNAAVRLVLPTDAAIRVHGEPKTVLDDPSFTGLKQGPGLAVIDFTQPDTPRFGCVVATLPRAGDVAWTADEVAALLGVPRGSEPPSPPPAGMPTEPAGPEPPATPARPLAWLVDYGAATAQAREQGRMLLVFFDGGPASAASREFEAKALAEPAVAEKLAKYVLLRLPADAQITVAGNEVALIRQPAFAEMRGHPGVAVIDHCNPPCGQCGQVVSVFPFLHGRAYNVEQTKVILDLPPGSLTQRTMIYAVRTHPERPASTRGRLDLNLLREAEKHSCHQARIRLQGHHAWESRFHRIRAMLAGGQIPCEVCAESWPGQGMLEAAVECVRCWRLSSGHWRAVSSPQQSYAYDMKRGDNGIWYATGIFGGDN